MAEAFGLGLDVGSTSVKACLINGGTESWSEVRAHDGDVVGTARSILAGRTIPDGTPTLVTGGEGRRQFRLERAIAPEALERALVALGLDATAVVSVGGEDLVVYRLDGGRIVGTYAGNKCASGTGEFFAQQLRRMDLPLEVVDSPEMDQACVHRLSSRCSVFMKSDCTHKLNKGEAGAPRHRPEPHARDGRQGAGVPRQGPGRDRHACSWWVARPATPTWSRRCARGCRAPSWWCRPRPPTSRPSAPRCWRRSVAPRSRPPRRWPATATWPTPAPARSARRPPWSPSTRRAGAGRAPGPATCWASTAAPPPPRWRWSTPRPARWWPATTAAPSATRWRRCGSASTR